MNNIKIGIIDYGVGNQQSIQNCLKSIGFKSKITCEISILDECQIILLPGVGAFSPSINQIKIKKIDKYLIDRAKTNTPIIGICLGMQLLAKTSSENGLFEGLNLIPGKVENLTKDNKFHIGWNSLKVIKENNIFVDEKEDFYFNHSYAFKELEDYSICSTKYGDIEFNSIIRKNNIIGLQFHPEKSQQEGKIFLFNLIKNLCDA